ncbi:trypsin-like peptidase domain-containing protein [Rhodopirellula sp. JC740]|uniref:Trypsin-like peptidase domain-containing protein n=1 Tax=Rhodopirellula halodulae TaxID=2894198 RepID=A0ABS8NGK7_9BACT|nr:trypsin-like peptidase domain-containing protein [Rhodopirellula sp. JC740]MCC9642670.1 trypsin-like peptidase domain-containing protein [Rhodopirellula sp. JC740]
MTSRSTLVADISTRCHRPRCHRYCFHGHSFHRHCGWPAALIVMLLGLTFGLHHGSRLHADDAAQVSARTLSKAFRDAARQATPSVVTVSSYGQNVTSSNNTSSDSQDGSDDFQEDLPNEQVQPSPPREFEDGKYELTGLGSGVIINPFHDASDDDASESPDQYWVMTNNHVIVNAKKVTIQFPDETELVAEKVHGDPASDIAVLQVTSDEPLTVAQYGDSTTLDIGDWVLAIGSPFKLEATVSAGIISAKNRILKQIRRSRLLQTDAAINPGNSGGPLVDLDGNVVAINTAIATRNGSYQGIGFAIPIDQAKWLARELAKYGTVRRSTLGITTAELTAKIAKKVRLPEGLGVLVYEIIRNSAADRAGLKQLDVITEFAGQPVHKPIDLRDAIERQPVGSKQSFKIIRGGEEMELEATLAPVDDPTASSGEEE